MFDTLVRWARFGELFAYDENRGVLLLSYDQTATS